MAYIISDVFAVIGYFRKTFMSIQNEQLGKIGTLNQTHRFRNLLLLVFGLLLFS